MNRIHLKIENSNARGFKKELLLLEAGSLNSIKKIKDFKKTRKTEFSTKNKIRRSFRDINRELNKIHQMTPHLEKTRIVKKIIKGKEEGMPQEVKEAKTKGKEKKKISKTKKMDNVERQLQDIKEKLASLG